jgi:hypothetical protein
VFSLNFWNGLLLLHAAAAVTAASACCCFFVYFLLNYDSAKFASAWCMTHAALQMRIAPTSSINPVGQTIAIHGWPAGCSPKCSPVSVWCSGGLVDDDSLDGRMV